MKKNCVAAIAVVLLGTYAGHASAAPVGRTQGNFMVAADGSAAYSIPLWSPPGVRGLRPSLSLVYNSNSGNGLLGVGWSLSGFSLIARCAKTIAQDGNAANSVLDITDRFCVDGNRLRATSGTYGAPNSVYQTEIANFSQIISRGTAGTGPAWFEVKSKDGLTYEYGHTTDSAVVGSGSSTVRVWALSAVRDRGGNSMTFTYVNDTANGSYRPSSIQYTFTGGSTSNNSYKIDFAYEPRAATDTLWTYAEGGKSDEPNRLREITARFWNGAAWSAVRSYTLTYTNSPTTSRTRLTSVQECAVGECLPATTIGYQDGQTAWGSEIAQAGNLLNMPNSMPVDVNGDGKTDLVYADQATARWFYHLGQASGVFQGPYDSGLTSANYTTAFAMDYDANGSMDILIQNASGNWRVMFFQSAGSGFTFTDTGVPAAAAGKAMARDLDGDGREDLLYGASAAGWGTTDNVYYRLNTAAGFGPQTTLATFTNCISSACVPRVKINGTAQPFSGQQNHYNTSTRVADFNEDGRADIFILTGVCWADNPSQCGNVSNPITYRQTIYMSQSGGGYTPLDLVTSSNVTPASLPLVGDFNGDNCSDVAYTVSSSWRLQFGTCYRAGATSVLTPAVSTGVAFHGLSPLAVDWDGDGRTDIVQANNASPKRWVVLRSTGSTLSSAADLGINYPTSTSYTTLYVSDVNGDGVDDLLYSTFNGVQPAPLFTRIHNGVAPDLANSFTDGFGISHAPGYVSPAHNNYSKGNGAVYPEKEVTPTQAVVRYVTSSDGTGSTYSQQFWYYNARTNLQGEPCRFLRRQLCVSQAAMA